MNATRFALVMVLIGVLAGCASDRQREEQLQNTLDLYAAALRWGDFGRALALLDPEQRPDDRRLSLMLQRFDQVRVTGYRVTASYPGDDPDSVVQEAELRFSNRHTAVERSISDRQVWRWDAEAERWWLTTGLPDITRR